MDSYPYNLDLQLKNTFILISKNLQLMISQIIYLVFRAALLSIGRIAYKSHTGRRERTNNLPN